MKVMTTAYTMTVQTQYVRIVSTSAVVGFYVPLVYQRVPTGLDADSVAAMTTAAPSESTPQRLAAIREQLKLLSDYL
jgi:hypothetical protein